MTRHAMVSYGLWEHAWLEKMCFFYEAQDTNLYLAHSPLSTACLPDRLNCCCFMIRQFC